MMTILGSSELEAVAAQCRDAGFRESLATTPVVNTIAQTLRQSVAALDGLLARPVTNDGGSGGCVGGAIVDDDDDGLSYSFDVAQDAEIEAIADKGAVVALQAADPDAARRQIATITSAFRAVRNACAATPATQSACREEGILRLAHDVIIRCCRWLDVDDAALQSDVILLSQIALQFSVNAVTGNAANQTEAWALFFPDDFQKVLVECHQHRKIVAFATALILNCVNKQLEDEAVSQRRVDLVCARNLIITLLQRCLTRPTSNGDAPTDAGDTLSVDEQDPAFEWICLLFRVLFEAGYYKDLYNAVGAHMLSRLWSRVTPEQLILLRMFTMWMTSHREGPRAPGEDPDAALSRRLAALGLDGASRRAILDFVRHTWKYILTPEDGDRPEEADATRRRMWLEFENEAKLLLLDVMGELTLASHGGPPPASSDDAVADLLQSLLGELKRVWERRRLGPPSTTRPNGESRSPTPTTDEPFGYRSAIIRVVGNLCFRHTEHQDLVRDGGFLPLFLNHCNIDEANPFLREWSLVALRNLCEGNEANQAYINALRPQGIDKSSVNLENVNVEATLGEDGKVRVTRKEPAA